MRHELTLAGPCFRLRPVETDDAPFIVELRTDPELTRFLHPVSGRVEDQREWLATYFAREGDYYWIVERVATGAREGTIGLYALDAARRSAEWGRWVLARRSLAAVESAWLLYRLAFDTLGLATVFCRTIVANESVISFHRSTGLVSRGILRGHVKRGDEAADVLEQELSLEDWPRVEAGLRARVERLARRLSSDPPKDRQP